MKRLSQFFFSAVFTITALCLNAAEAADPVRAATPAAKTREPLKEDLDFEAAAKRINIHVPSSGPWKSIGEEMQAMRCEMLEDLYRIIGLTLPEGRKVEVGFSTSRSGGTWGFTGWKPWGASILIQSSNPVKQRLLLGRAILQHEMTHALQDSWLNKQLDRYFPSWISEGIATYTAGHGPRKLRSSVARSGSKFINGLGHHAFGASGDYAEGYLAFIYMDQVGGPGTVREFIRDITLNQTPWKEAITKHTKMEWDAFETGAKNFSRDFVAQIAPGKSTKDQPLKLDDDLPPPQIASQPTPPPEKPIPSPRPNVTAIAPPSTQPREEPTDGESFTLPQELGARLMDMDEQAARGMGLPAARCVVIVAVMDGSPSATAGFEAGDVILSLNQQPVASGRAFFAILNGLKPGKPVTVRLSREGRAVTVRLQFAKP